MGGGYLVGASYEECTLYGKEAKTMKGNTSQGGGER